MAHIDTAKDNEVPTDFPSALPPLLRQLIGHSFELTRP